MSVMLYLIMAIIFVNAFITFSSRKIWIIKIFLKLQYYNEYILDGYYGLDE
jgi:hypothetical protein